MKFIQIESFGNKTFVNTECIESVVSIDGKTRIITACGEGYFETEDPIDAVMRKITEEDV